jgi:two-component SAPR family response regulator
MNSILVLITTIIIGFALIVYFTYDQDWLDNILNEFTKPSLALEHFKINYKDYSLVISDIRMPKMNGFEFARSVSRVKPEIKVLLMTAFDIDSHS